MTALHRVGYHGENQGNVIGLRGQHGFLLADIMGWLL